MRVFDAAATRDALPFGRLIPALIFLWLELSVYWIFSIMLLDYSIKAVLLLHRFRSRKWLNIKLDSAA